MFILFSLIFLIPFFLTPVLYLLSQLVSKSDVLVENYLPGKLDKLKLGYQHLSGVNPALVYCSITGFGETGPYASRGGYDIIAAAIAGLMHITGPRVHINATCT